jgi:hypothetical protein
MKWTKSIKLVDEVDWLPSLDLSRHPENKELDAMNHQEDAKIGLNHLCARFKLFYALL